MATILRPWLYGRRYCVSTASFAIGSTKQVPIIYHRCIHSDHTDHTQHNDHTDTRTASDTEENPSDIVEALKQGGAKKLYLILSLSRSPEKLLGLKIKERPWKLFVTSDSRRGGVTGGSIVTNIPIELAPYLLSTLPDFMAKRTSFEVSNDGFHVLAAAPNLLYRQITVMIRSPALEDIQRDVKQLLDASNMDISTVKFPQTPLMIQLYQAEAKRLTRCMNALKSMLPKGPGNFKISGIRLMVHSHPDRKVPALFQDYRFGHRQMRE